MSYAIFFDYFQRVKFVWGMKDEMMVKGQFFQRKPRLFGNEAECLGYMPAIFARADFPHRFGVYDMIFQVAPDFRRNDAVFVGKTATIQVDVVCACAQPLERTVFQGDTRG
ncbi:hypothetical protein ABK905_23595 [Acerihabitans sp. KWT182]|uniref:Uncharacterized protein n=1 Tax=Acerihabitans sp. KWT182 TaxID=3157919 RepID=A0AAU7Q8X0_9GAMM